MLSRLKSKFKARRFSRNREGATAVEAAICFPIVIAMFFAAFEYGIFFYHNFNISKSMDEAAREIQFMEDPTASEIRTYLDDTILDSTPGFVFYHVSKTEHYDHEFARIWMVYLYPLNIPFIDDNYVYSQYRNMIVLGEAPPAEETT